MLKALNGPYGGKVSFIPTGGVGPKNLIDYLSCPNVFAVGGSWMVPSDAVKAGDWGRIEALCHEARLLSLLLHIGINPQCECCALDEARMFAAMLGMPFKEGNSSAFVGKSFEFMKAQGRGEKGHIAIETLSVERALEWGRGLRGTSEQKIRAEKQTARRKGEIFFLRFFVRRTF